MMKNWRIVTGLLLSLILGLSMSCSGGKTAESGDQLVEVVRGDLRVTVSGSGNIEVSNERELTFGTGGRVDEIFVEEGDSVSEGDKLAALETDSLEVALAQAEVTYAQAQSTLKSAEHNLEKAQDVYAEADITAARTAVRNARSYLEDAQSQLDKAIIEWDRIVWTNEVEYAEEQLRIAESALNEKLSAPDTDEVAIKRSLVEVAQQSLELASLSLAQAQKQLDEATITAPFAGVIAKIDVKEGDIVPPSTLSSQTIIHLIDPTVMELIVEVDEIDIPNVDVDQKAIIEVDALPALILEGKVSSISLLSTKEAGVIVYDVKISFNVDESIGLRDGMSADADIVITEQADVLLVPSRAIKEDSYGNAVVEVMVGKKIEERPVVAGISDGLDTVIISGLNEGETVVGR
ncbi:MAG: efflux RND transporter periplasmic adaptor subunit [Dehalococcoidales bacterium]|nr:efflux RND transporter periplasmic adaptor subunit [Dehalococcoidales bacterium]